MKLRKHCSKPNLFIKHQGQTANNFTQFSAKRNSHQLGSDKIRSNNGPQHGTSQRHTVYGSEIPFPTTRDVKKKPRKVWDKQTTPTPAGEFTGFLNHQQCALGKKTSASHVTPTSGGIIFHLKGMLHFLSPWRPRVAAPGSGASRGQGHQMCWRNIGNNQNILFLLRWFIDMLSLFMIDTRSRLVCFTMF